MNQFEAQLLETIIQHPEKIQVRLARTILFELDVWDVELYLRTFWRWN